MNTTKKKFGLDFGTTNSSIAIAEAGTGKVLEVDMNAGDPRVVRSMLHFNRREFQVKGHVNKAKILNNTFEVGDYEWVGEFHPKIGQEAITTYLEENKHRTSGTKRTIFTGRIISTETMQEVKGGAGAVREYYEEIDYGVGRLMQALKTALKSPYYKGTTVFGQFFTLEQLIGTFLKELKKKADMHMGEEITAVVCGRPVHFLNNPEKDANVQKRLEEGLKHAGFTDIQFEYEPVAAAKQFIALEENLRLKPESYVLVFDFGGGTLDTAIVKTNGMDSRLRGNDSKVLAVDGVYIGGDLLNADIMRAKLWEYFGSKAIWGDYNLPVPAHIYENLQSWFSIPNLNNPEIMNQFMRLRYKHSDVEALERLIYLIRANLGFNLYESIERAKKHLSFYDSSRIVFKDGIINIDVEITKMEFESIIKPRVDEIRETVLRTLETAQVEAAQIDVVVRTGGSSLIPIFEAMLVDIFGKEKIRQFETFTSIAGGLALAEK
jgi:hypothetical chaperone protein